MVRFPQFLSTFALRGLRFDGNIGETSWFGHDHFKHDERRLHCPKSENTTTVHENVDIFMRSYIGDIKWLTYSATSIAESMSCSPCDVRHAVLVVPPSDVEAFKATLDHVWKGRDLEESLRERFKVLPSNISIPGNGEQEQMLDKIHADQYTDAETIVFVDTDTVLALDLTRDQLFDSAGKPYLCYRNVDECAPHCGHWMQNYVKPMLGDGEGLNYEFMCRLGQAYRSNTFPKLRQRVQNFRGDTWNAFVSSALNGGASPWSEGDGSDGFTEFNALGALLWQEHHDDVHWVRWNTEEMNNLGCTVQAWSWANGSVVEEAEQMFECLLLHQHDQGGTKETRCAQRQGLCALNASHTMNPLAP